MTGFARIYNRFLGKITDDMYMELTPADTIKDLQRLLINSIPNFEFPRKNLDDFTIKTEIINEQDVKPEEFIIGVVWAELPDEPEPAPRVIIEKSYFEAELTDEEINILAILMMEAWLQRQVTSIENVRMKYSGTDFKMTSQANHLQKLLSLQNECRRQSHHMQRLYKRREINPDTGLYRSTWYQFGQNGATQ